jgi:hypothetical protein
MACCLRGGIEDGVWSSLSSRNAIVKLECASAAVATKKRSEPQLAEAIQ